MKEHDCGRHHRIRIPAMEEAVLNFIDEEPDTNSRKNVLRLIINHMMVWTKRTNVTCKDSRFFYR